VRNASTVAGFTLTASRFAGRLLSCEYGPWAWENRSFPVFFAGFMVQQAGVHALMGVTARTDGETANLPYLGESCRADCASHAGIVI
jgi:hypothetical protein